jgi:hypothetical protein
VIGTDLVALHPALGIEVDRVQVEALGPGDLRHRELGVGAQLVGGAGSPGVVAGALDAARQGAIRVLEAAHVVALPAVQRDRDLVEARERGVDVDIDGRIGLASQRVGAFDGGVLMHEVPFRKGRR